MAKKPIPTPEELRQLLRYEPETGNLIWKERPITMFQGRRQSADYLRSWWNSRYAGTPALTAKEGGNRYLHGLINSKTFKAHRVAWAIHYGEWPKNFIDHINGDVSDNRISNLRDVSRQDNSLNSKMMRNNTSGYVGVSLHTMTGRWQAYAGINGKTVYLGLYESPAEAAAVRDDFMRSNNLKCAAMNSPVESEVGVRGG